MRVEILYCKPCKVFTMKDACPKCSSKTFSTKPARYSPDDKWAKYRREAKAEATQK
ncbi:MAG TPA: RNA-protein complex protein Nop10 [Candidatus Nanoarchaeia archaeon]|nr:RNA-protein complex protein Nop10 [Candidatus Nanoarchaeia archaeon]